MKAPIFIIKEIVYCVMIHIVQRNLGASGWIMFHRVLRELQEPDPGAWEKLAAIGCVYWWPTPIGGTG